MKSALSNIAFLFLAGLLSVAYSIYLDWGSHSWIWFQRSGSLLALTGAILGYRSIVRLGLKGVGGASPTAIMGTIVSVDDSGPRQMLKVSYDEETLSILHQAAIDRLAGYFGAGMMVMGTIIWGYGDLVGQLL